MRPAERRKIVDRALPTAATGSAHGEGDGRHLCVACRGAQMGGRYAGRTGAGPRSRCVEARRRGCRKEGRSRTCGRHGGPLVETFYRTSRQEAEPRELLEAM